MNKGGEEDVNRKDLGFSHYQYVLVNEESDGLEELRSEMEGMKNELKEIKNLIMSNKK